MAVSVVPAYRVVATLVRRASQLPADEAIDAVESGLREYVRSLLSTLHPSIMDIGERSAIAQIGDPDMESLLEALVAIEQGGAR